MYFNMYNKIQCIYPFSLYISCYSKWVMYHILEHVIDALAINAFYHRQIYFIYIHYHWLIRKKSRQSQTDRPIEITSGF